MVGSAAGFLQGEDMTLIPAVGDVVGTSISLLFSADVPHTFFLLQTPRNRDMFSGVAGHVSREHALSQTSHGNGQYCLSRQMSPPGVWWQLQ